MSQAEEQTKHNAGYFLNNYVKITIKKMIGAGVVALGMPVCHVGMCSLSLGYSTSDFVSC